MKELSVLRMSNSVNHKSSHKRKQKGLKKYYLSLTTHFPNYAQVDYSGEYKTDCQYFNIYN